MTALPWLFRIGSHPSQGGGHVARSLCLARAVAARAPVLFVLDRGSEAVQDRLAAEGIACAFEGAVLPDPVAGTLIDSYRLTAAALAGFAARGALVVMDDFLDPPAIADLVVNAACHLSGDRVAGIPALLGPRYALVDRRFRRPDAPVREIVARIVVTFGRLDPDNVTGMALRALEQLAATGFTPAVDCVIAAASPHRDAVVAAAARLGDRARVSVDATDMPARLHAADLVIGAGGVSLFERAAAGVPSVTCSIADNQDAFVEGAGRIGITRVAGPARSVTVPGIAAAVAAMAADPVLRARMVSAGRTVVDGGGADRIAVAMIDLAGPPVAAADGDRRQNRMTPPGLSKEPAMNTHVYDAEDRRQRGVPLREERLSDHRPGAGMTGSL